MLLYVDVWRVFHHNMWVNNETIFIFVNYSF